jgi:hypothetical protein
MIIFSGFFDKYMFKLYVFFLLNVSLKYFYTNIPSVNNKKYACINNKNINNNSK